MHTVKIAVHSAEGCCTATTMALTSSKQKIIGIIGIGFIYILYLNVIMLNVVQE